MCHSFMQYANVAAAAAAAVTLSSVNNKGTHELLVQPMA